MHIHLIFDLTAYFVGFVVAFVFFKTHKQKSLIEKDLKVLYYSVVVIGFVIGSTLFGTINLYYSNVLFQDHQFFIGKSVLGALLGGIIAVEIFKKIYDIKGSTGAYFVPSLAIGIAIGRIGCFLSGLEDYTYGVETSSILGVDFGDGLLRHPVQLYESVTMFLFFIYVIVLFQYNKQHFEQKIFYEFILVYDIQRFVWEFLKPYEEVLWGLNIFQLLNIVLVFYAIYYLRLSNVKADKNTIS